MQVGSALSPQRLVTVEIPLVLLVDGYGVGILGEHLKGLHHLTHGPLVDFQCSDFFEAVTRPFSEESLLVVRTFI